MQFTWIHYYHMSKMIQLRNVPDKLHRTLKSRAAMEGLSLSEYLLSHIRELAKLPTPTEMRERLRRRTSVVPPLSSSEILREERDRR